MNSPVTHNPPSDRDGNWMDKLGACKVCDGEIPHGHSENCDIYKLELQIRRYEMLLARDNGASSPVTHNPQEDAFYERVDPRIKRWTSSEVMRAINESCSCGGKGPNDQCCAACEVWHRLHERPIGNTK